MTAAAPGPLGRGAREIDAIPPPSEASAAAMRHDPHRPEPRRDVGPERRPGIEIGRSAKGPRWSLLWAIGLALPHLITAAFAGVLSRVALPGPASVPLAALGVLGIQMVGVLLAREVESPVVRRVWLVLLAMTTVVLPLVALQTSLLRVPFVSLGRGSAGSLIWATVAATAAVAGLVGLAAVLSADAPENASLLFVPVAMLVPAVLGARGDLNEQAALAALAEATTVSGIAVALGWLLPRGARPLVAAVALGAQFLILWAVGSRPAFGEDHGATVAVCAGVLLVVTVTAAVLVPVASLATRRFARAVGAVEREGS